MSKVRFWETDEAFWAYRYETAARVLAGMLADPRSQSEDRQVVAEAAVKYADALIAALDAEPEGA